MRASSGAAGQATAATLALAVALLVVVPALVMLAGSDERWAVKEERSSEAFYLAEAGVDRGVWELLANPSWFDALSYGPVAGYAFDRVYSDVASTGAAPGSYTLLLSSYSLFGTPLTADERVITASGRDALRREVRTVELVVSRGVGLEAALYASGIAFSGGGGAQWGPLMSRNSIALSGGSCLQYPQMYADGGITGCAVPFDNNPAEPNYDTNSPAPHTQFWSYGEPPGVPPPMSPDLTYYRALAQCSTCAVAAGFPGGGFYYNGNYTYGGVHDTGGAMVRYVEGNLTINACVGTLGVIIAMGNLNFSGGPCDTGQWPGHYPLTVNVPAGAWRQYQKVDTSSSGEYPGDLGGPGAAGQSPTYTFGAASNGPAQTKLTISHQGFAYTASRFYASGGTVIVGAVYAPNDPGGGSGGSHIYFQDGLDIRGFGTGGLARGTWRQTTPHWPPALP